MKRTIILIAIAIVMAGMVYAQESGKPSSSSGTMRSITLPNITVELKPGPDKSKVDSYCMICHSTDYITMQPAFPRAQWTATVNKMIKTFGAPVSDEDAKMIINYLVANYGTGN